MSDLLAHLPPVGDPALVIALSVVFVALGMTAAISAWADNRFPLVGLLVLALAALGALWVAQTEPLRLTMVPEAFIELAARILR